MRVHLGASVGLDEECSAGEHLFDHAVDFDEVVTCQAVLWEVRGLTPASSFRKERRWLGLWPAFAVTMSNFGPAPLAMPPLAGIDSASPFESSACEDVGRWAINAVYITVAGGRERIVDGRFRRAAVPDRRGDR